MKNYKFGYARVSTEEQVLDRQIDMLSEYGVNQIYSEKMTGTKRNRPELEKMLDRLSEGDTVVIESLSRLGRSTKDLIELMELFNKKKVNLVSLKENIDTTTATGKLLFTLISAISQFERDCIADRTREGLTADKQWIDWQGKKTVRYKRIYHVRNWRTYRSKTCYFIPAFEKVKMGMIFS